MSFKQQRDTARSTNYEGLYIIQEVDSIQQELVNNVEYISEESPSIDFLFQMWNILLKITLIASDKFKEFGI
jgi:predicted restriction endonuclease